MDRQHGSLVDSFSFLEVAPRRRESDLPELDRIIVEMEGHFRWEEEQMRLSGFPNLASHQADHKRQVANLKDIRRMVFEGMETIDLEFFRACQAWNLRHIRGQDLEFALFLHERELWDLRHELRSWDLEQRIELLPG
jgi:hemerythrin-like metal-binding protein